MNKLPVPLALMDPHATGDAGFLNADNKSGGLSPRRDFQTLISDVNFRF